MMKRSAIIFQPTLVSYRRRLFDLMADFLHGELTVYYGATATSSSVKTSVDDAEWAVPVNNRWMIGRRMMCQGSMSKAVWFEGLVILNLNPRFVHNWLILLCRNLMGKKTIVWGHYLSRKGRGGMFNILRRAQMKMADGVMLYTKTELDLYKKDQINVPVFATSNSCVMRDECVVSDKYERDAVIYVGRLTEKKKPDLLIKSFLKAYEKNNHLKMIIAGGGEEEARLRSVYSDYIRRGIIEMHGWVWDAKQLSDLYSKAIVAVSSGYVGLNVIQSFAYGVPVIVARGECHSPEIEACIDGFNCTYFEMGDEEDLANTMIGIVEKKKEWGGRMGEISNMIRNKYTIEGMMAAFEDCFSNVCNWREDE